jgi:hypothetical protein
MNKKKATIIVLIIIIFLGCLYFLAINKEGIVLENKGVGYNYYPNILTALLILFSLISLFQTLREKVNEKITINLKLFLITAGLLTVYLLSWSLVGYFYLNTFIFLLATLIIYGKKDRLRGLVTVSILISLSMSVIIYVLFTRIMNIQF